MLSNIHIVYMLHIQIYLTICGCDRDPGFGVPVGRYPRVQGSFFEYGSLFIIEVGTDERSKMFGFSFAFVRSQDLGSELFRVKMIQLEICNVFRR